MPNTGWKSAGKACGMSKPVTCGQAGRRAQALVGLASCLRGGCSACPPAGVKERLQIPPGLLLLQPLLQAAVYSRPHPPSPTIHTHANTRTTHTHTHTIARARSFHLAWQASSRLYPDVDEAPHQRPPAVWRGAAPRRRLAPSPPAPHRSPGPGTGRTTCRCQLQRCRRSLQR
jgi:hypothetical protein